MKFSLDYYRENLTSKDKMIEVVVKAIKNYFSDPSAKAFLPTDHSFDKIVWFLELVAENSVRQGVDTIFAHAESEIEKIFLSSLLLRASIEKLFFFIFTEPLTSPFLQIEELRERCSIAINLIQSRRQVCIGDVFQDFINYVYSLEDTEDNKLVLIAFVLSYVALNFYEKFHISIQSTFPDIKVNGKSIRPDIFIWLPSNPSFKLIVECDGYAYHSDKRSFTNDRNRDRILQMKGFQVFRFSGQEIYHDPVQKSHELYDYLIGLQNNSNAKQESPHL